MRWWVWKPAPLSEYLASQGRAYRVECYDRDPGQWRRPVYMGVFVSVRGKKRAREMARALNRRTGVPVGWPGSDDKWGNLEGL
jgi:hypothetical protein